MVEEVEEIDFEQGHALVEALDGKFSNVGRLMNLTKINARNKIDTAANLVGRTHLNAHERNIHSSAI